MKKIKFIPICLFIFVLLTSNCLGKEEMLNQGKNTSEEYMQSKYNPDEDKYDFVKSYITSLSYLKLNEERSIEEDAFTLSRNESHKKTSVLIDNLALNNINLRIARNLLKKFQFSKNGLIIKVSQTFIKTCDDQIAINNLKRQLLDKLFEAQVSDKLKTFDKKAFMSEYKNLSTKRKELSRSLVEASILVGKVLISNKADINVNFSKLGITKIEREKLISKINEFKGEAYQGEIREGQSFLEASVASISSVLKDNKLKSVDE